MLYTVRLKPSVEKELKKIPASYYYRIQAVFSRLQTDPWIGKKLEGEYMGYYALRAWPYRVIYRIYKYELLVIVVKVGHRQGVYG